MALGARLILLAEDTTPIRNILEYSLRRAGYLVECVSDGEAADRVLQQTGFELVITDFMMPKLTGVQLIRRMRQRGDTTPVLLISGTVGAAALSAARRYGAVEVLEKPFKLRDVKEKVDRMLLFSGPGGHRAV